MTGMAKAVKRSLLAAVAPRIAPALAPIVRFMAWTGAGSDACLKRDCLPLPVHFYSPVPDLRDLERRQVWGRTSEMAGIAFRPDAQLALLTELGRIYGHECDWPFAATGEQYQFYTENPSFSYGCAAGLHCMVRRFKPRRVIEIGSGNSSLVFSKALALNAGDSSPAAEYVIVDPYPQPKIKQNLPGLNQLVEKTVESVDPVLFDRLGANDILFIDSSHTVRTGGDVNFLTLDVLPRLAPGVIVHFHDIELPGEYSKKYATNPQFRVFWTEAYLLQAFLCFNSEFEVMLAFNYLMTKRTQEFQAAFPQYDPLKHKSVSGSFWIRRRVKGQTLPMEDAQ